MESEKKKKIEIKKNNFGNIGLQKNSDEAKRKINNNLESTRFSEKQENCSTRQKIMSYSWMNQHLNEYLK